MCFAYACKIQKSHDGGHIVKRRFFEGFDIGKRTDFDHHAVCLFLAHDHLREFCGIVIVNFGITAENVDAGIACGGNDPYIAAVLHDVLANGLLTDIVTGETAAVGFAPCRDLTGICFCHQLADQLIELHADGIGVLLSFKEQRKCREHRFAVFRFIRFK